jgi:hypothetical protein
MAAEVDGRDLPAVSGKIGGNPPPPGEARRDAVDQQDAALVSLTPRSGVEGHGHEW